MKPRRPRPDEVIHAVCRKFSVSPDRIVDSRDRHKRCVHAREAAWWLLHEVCELSYPESGRVMMTCHSTGVDAVKRVRARIASDDVWTVDVFRWQRCERVLIEIVNSLDYEPKMKAGLAA